MALGIGVAEGQHQNFAVGTGCEVRVEHHVAVPDRPWRARAVVHHGVVRIDLLDHLRIDTVLHPLGMASDILNHRADGTDRGVDHRLSAEGGQVLAGSFELPGADAIVVVDLRPLSLRLGGEERAGRRWR